MWLIMKNSFYCEDIPGVIKRLWYTDKYGCKGNLFPSKFFKQYGLSTRKVNSIAKDNNIFINILSVKGKLYYGYTSEKVDNMNDFVNELNSYIILNKIAGWKSIKMYLQIQ